MKVKDNLRILNELKGTLIRFAQEAGYEVERAKKQNAKESEHFERGRQRAFEKSIGQVDFWIKYVTGKADPNRPMTKEVEWEPRPNTLFHDMMAGEDEH